MSVLSQVVDRRRLTAIATVVCWATATACVRRPFDRYFEAEQWSDAARALAVDPAQLDDERTLYRVGVLYSSPARATYDPERAQALFRRLLQRFPASRFALDAADRLSLVDAVLAGRTAAAAREQAIEARIAELEADVERLHASLDSADDQRATLRRASAKLEADLRDRDEQLRALRSELKQLKAIDLRPRGAAVRRPPER